MTTEHRRQQNRECSKRWRERNPGRATEDGRRRRAENPERTKREQREYYLKNKERLSEYSKQRYNERKQILIEHLGGCCVKCNTTENLEFDHINPSTKEEESIATIGTDKAMEVIDKFQLLCHDCHQKKSDAQKAAAWKLFCSLTLEEQEELL